MTASLIRLSGKKNFVFTYRSLSESIVYKYIWQMWHTFDKNNFSAIYIRSINGKNFVEKVIAKTS